MPPSQAAAAPRGTVPLEAGIGPDNPPCPVCGEPLFGWATLPLSDVPVRRCETCDLGVAGEPPSRAEALEILRGSGERVPNRRAMVARLGASGWAGIERGRRLIFSKEAARRLGARARTRPSVSLAAQTLLNSFTFGHNIGLGMLGRAEPAPAPARWQRRIDRAISVLASPVILVAAAVAEAIGSAAGRGGALRVDWPEDSG